MSSSVSLKFEDEQTRRSFLEAVPVDPSLYQPTQEDVAWLKKETGIQDEEELKKHALATQAEGLAVSLSCFKAYAVE